MAYRRNSLIDHALSIAASLFHSVPSYLFGIMVIVFFGVRLGWLPVARHARARSPPASQSS